MGNNNSGTYTVKYPDGFNEKHTEIDHGLSYFKNDLEAAQRAGRGPSGIKERAQNRKKLKGYEMGIKGMANQRADIMSKSKTNFSEQDFNRWQEMIDQLTTLYKECKNLLENSTRRTAKKKADEGTTADDFLRGDGGGGGAKKSQERTSGGNLRTGKMSEQERQAMKEINDKEEVMDDLADQITENLEFLQIKAEMIGEEIESQKDLVDEVNKRAHNTKDRTKRLNQDIERTMEADGMQKAEQKKKEGSKDLKTKVVSNLLKGAIS